MSRNETLYAYLRVSTQQQVEKDLSLPEQRKLAQEYADKNGLAIEILEDAGKTAFDPDPSSRPSFTTLLDLIKKGKVRQLWIWNYNRLSREQAASAALQYAIFSSNSKDLQIIQGDSGQLIGFDSPEASMMFAMINYQTVKSSEDFKKQMRRGHNSWLMKGGWPSPTLPYGYSTDENRNLNINEEEAKVVREIFDLRIKEKLGYTSIANELNKRGIPPRYKEGRKLASGINNRRTEGLTSGKWERSSVRNILLNELYYGQRIIVNNDWEKKGGKNVLKGQKEIFNENIKKLAIISEETYKKAQAIKLGSKAVSNKGSYDALLKGLITCGDCGNSVRPWISPNRGSYLYRCTHNRNTYKNREDRCWSKGMNITMVNDLVYDAIRSSETYHQVITELFDNKTTKEELKKLKQQESKLKKDIEITKESFNRIKQLYLMSHFTFDEYTKETDIGSKQLLILEEELSLVQSGIIHLKNQSSHTDLSKQMINHIQQQLKNVELLYSASRLQYKKGSMYYNAMKAVFNAVVDKVDLSFHAESKNHILTIDFNKPNEAMKRLKKIPWFDSIDIPEVNNDKFTQNTVSKTNPIENRGLTVNLIVGMVREDFTSTKADMTEAIDKLSTPKLIGDELNGIMRLVGSDVPKQLHRNILPTFKVKYKYQLGNSRKEVEKIVFYSE